MESKQKMTEIIASLRAAASKCGKSLERLFTSELVLVAGNLPEIAAAARYWRDQLSKSSISSMAQVRGHLQIAVKEALTDEELDDFEQALAYELARAKIHDHKSPIFTVTGQEAAGHLICAANAARVDGKISYWGFMTRIRILPDRVDREVGAIFDYGDGNWQNVWRKT